MDQSSRSINLFIARMLVRLLAPLSFVVLVIATSYLHTEQLAGELVTLLSIVMVCSTIGRLGFDQLILEKRPDRQEDSKAIISSCCLLGTLLSGLTATVFVGAIQFTTLLQGFKLIAGPTVIFSCVFATIAQLSSTYAQSRLQTTLATTLFPLLTYLIAFVALVLLRLPLQLAVLLAYAAPALIGLGVLCQAQVLSTANFTGSVAAQSKYFAMNNIAALSYNWLINVYVAALLGSEELVLFTLITRIAAILSLPATASTPLIQAGISEKHSSGESRSIARFSGLVVLATTILQLLCIGVLTILGAFTDHLNGVLDSGLVFAFLLYCITQIFHVLAGPAGSILLMTGESRRVSRLTVFLGATSLVLGISFTWIYGLAGTLFVSGIISVIQNLCYNLMLFQRDGYLPIQVAFATLWRRGRQPGKSSIT